MSSTTWLVVIYATALVLEAAGILLVVLDIRSDLRAARNLATMPGPSWSAPRGRRPVVQKRGPHAGVDTEGRRREAENVRASQVAYSATLEAIVGILTGNVRRRALGVVLILGGLLVGTAGNVWSLYV